MPSSTWGASANPIRSRSSSCSSAGRRPLPTPRPRDPRLRAEVSLPLRLAIASLALLLPIRAFADDPKPPPATSHGDVRFTVDAAGFATSGSETREEIYIQVPSSELAFRPAGEAFAARLEVEFAYRDTSSDAPILEKTMLADLTVKTEAQARDRGEIHVLQSEFLLAPGSYRLDVKLKDVNAPQRSLPLFFVRRPAMGKVTLALDVPSFGDSAFHVSDIEFAREISDSAGDSPFRKGEFTVVPCPERVYGLLIPELSAYFEIYHRDDGHGHPSPARLVGEVRDHAGQTVLSQEETLVLQAGGGWAKTLLFDLSQLPSGQYELVTELLLSESREKAVARGDFDVIWTMYSWNKKIEELVEELVPVATEADIGRLKRLSAGERELFLEEFWASLDPTPGTARNEALEEHYQRIRIADRVFAGRVRGSRTDRGRIFVKFGQPDEISTGFATEEFIGSLPFTRRNQFDFDVEGRAKGGINFENKPYETWTYDYRGDPIARSDHGGTAVGLKFIFVDFTGLGDFRMIFSSENVE